MRNGTLELLVQSSGEYGQHGNCSATYQKSLYRDTYGASKIGTLIMIHRHGQRRKQSQSQKTLRYPHPHKQNHFLHAALPVSNTKSPFYSVKKVIEMKPRCLVVGLCPCHLSHPNLSGVTRRTTRPCGTTDPCSHFQSPSRPSARPRVSRLYTDNFMLVRKPPSLKDT